MSDTLPVQSTEKDWRYYWGIASAVMFVLVVTAVVFMYSYGILMNKVDVLDKIPSFITALSPFFGLAMGVLGINAWHSGVADVAAAKVGDK